MSYTTTSSRRRDIQRTTIDTKRAPLIPPLRHYKDNDDNDWPVYWTAWAVGALSLDADPFRIRYMRVTI